MIYMELDEAMIILLKLVNRHCQIKVSKGCPYRRRQLARKNAATQKSLKNKKSSTALLKLFRKVLGRYYSSNRRDVRVCTLYIGDNTLRKIKRPRGIRALKRQNAMHRFNLFVFSKKERLLK